MYSGMEKERFSGICKASMDHPETKVMPCPADDRSTSESLRILEIGQELEELEPTQVCSLTGGKILVKFELHQLFHNQL